MVTQEQFIQDCKNWTWYWTQELKGPLSQNPIEGDDLAKVILWRKDFYALVKTLPEEYRCVYIDGMFHLFNLYIKWEPTCGNVLSYEEAEWLQRLEAGFAQLYQALYRPYGNAS